MPVDFDDLLKASTITDMQSGKIVEAAILKETLSSYNSSTVISIDKNRLVGQSSGRQVLCRTSGVWSATDQLGLDYLDLIYIFTFGWNGTLRPHAFDKEMVIVRLVRSTTWTPYRIFGSTHGYGKWYSYAAIDKEDGRPIMYSAKESHAIYSDILTHKRVFGFGNDVTRRDIRWEPSEAVVFVPTMNRCAVYDVMTGARVLVNTEHYMYTGRIGNHGNNQLWPGSRLLDFDTNNLDGFFLYGGGIANLFDGGYPLLEPATRMVIFGTSSLLLLTSLIGIIVFSRRSKRIYTIGLLLLMVIACLYIGVETFVLDNP